MAELLRRVVAKRAEEERRFRAADRASFFPFTEEDHELCRIRISLMQQDIDLFAALAKPTDYDSQRRITKSIQWGMQHLRPTVAPRGTWPNDPSLDDLAQRVKRRRAQQAQAKAADSSFSRRGLGGPGSPGQGIPDHARAVTLEEVVAAGEGRLWNDELSRRVARLNTLELAVSDGFECVILLASHASHASHAYQYYMAWSDTNDASVIRSYAMEHVSFSCEFIHELSDAFPQRHSRMTPETVRCHGDSLRCSLLRPSTESSSPQSRSFCPKSTNGATAPWPRTRWPSCTASALRSPRPPCGSFPTKCGEGAQGITPYLCCTSVLLFDWTCIHAMTNCFLFPWNLAPSRCRHSTDPHPCTGPSLIHALVPPFSMHGSLPHPCMGPSLLQVRHGYSDTGGGPDAGVAAGRLPSISARGPSEGLRSLSGGRRERTCTSAV